MVCVRLVDLAEDLLGKGMGRGGEEDEFGAWVAFKWSSATLHEAGVIREELTGGGLETGHLERLCLDHLDAGTSWDGADPTGDGVDAVEGTGENEVLVGRELRETLCCELASVRRTTRAELERRCVPL